MSDFPFKVGDRITWSRPGGSTIVVTAVGEERVLGRYVGNDSYELAFAKTMTGGEWLPAAPTQYVVEYRPPKVGERFFPRFGDPRDGPAVAYMEFDYDAPRPVIVQELNGL